MLTAPEPHVRDRTLAARDHAHAHAHALLGLDRVAGGEVWG
ncbi:hypothetical protein [Streptomyces sp. NPDC093707]